MLEKYKAYSGEYFALLRYFYGERNRYLSVEPNDEMFEALNEMLGSCNDTQDAVNLLPSVPGFQPGAFALGMYVIKLGAALLKKGAPMTWHQQWQFDFNMMFVKRAIAYKFRTHLDIAAIASY